ncbi:uncharacterized protein LOC120188963 [Hibiscus syriacus]|uniref:uncharacterized protein LOC120188963 n=1 Tax=Hibiscus syriacus TaxID=106335 RepID=UPI0019247C96|nr:uncharacterized protein LOC120188963 [Hibiscus syriacus]
MLMYQCEDAVRFWSSQKRQDREHVGVVSMQHQKFTQTVGSKSFACIANEEENTSGSKVGRIQLFDMTHTKKGGTPMTAEAAEIMEKLKEKKAEYHVTGSSHNLFNDDDIENRAINNVLGPERYGRVRFGGEDCDGARFGGLGLIWTVGWVQIGRLLQGDNSIQGGNLN